MGQKVGVTHWLLFTAGTQETQTIPPRLADFTVWRNNLGATGTGLAADGNGDSVVDAADYGVWKEHFGQSTGAVGEVSTVPEPGTALQWGVLALAVVGAKAVTRRRRRG